MAFDIEINSDPLGIARGLLENVSIVHKFGCNANVPNGVFEDIWANGGTYPFPQAAETVRIKAGGNAADTAAGAGARKVLVIGLDENGDLASEEITTNGASASAATTIVFFRVFRAYVTDCGTYGGTNTGAISVENTTSTNVLAMIDAGLSQTQMTMYAVPRGYTAYLSMLSTEVDATKPAEVIMWQRRNFTNVSVFTSKRMVHRSFTVAGAAPFSFKSYIEFPALTDLWFSAQGVGAATSVGVTYDLFLVNNEA